MRKRIVSILAVFALSNCEIKVREVNAQSSSFNYVYTNEKVIVNDMEYLLFYVKFNTSQTGYCVNVVNLTKDKLEIEKDKLEIELLKRQLSDTLDKKKRK